VTVSPTTSVVRDLTRAECLHRLAEATFGRVGATSRALPVILPVNYRLIGEEVVFRTSPGTKLALASAGTIVAFEIDGIDAVEHHGWSVLAIGRARVVTDPAELDRLATAGVPRWVEGDHERFIAVATTQLTGREIGLAP
jgi:nitroimidazol reductase NimA-like FMN-containing flavoprotein (pyridoxamine 5'-phosphate oxidase superfamily)